MRPDTLKMATRWSRGLALLVALASVESHTDEGDANATLAMIECGLPGDRRSKVVDTSRCFAGDLCCCRYDAFDLADLLLTEEETVLSARIENVAGLPESLLVRRDVQATLAVHKVFRNTASVPSPKIQVRFSSDMFVWPETGVSRILARQAMASAHDELRWNWEGAIGSVSRRKAEPFPNCDNGVFTVDRDGALEVGGTYLFVLDVENTETYTGYVVSDNARWNVFSGDEMDEVVHALTYTNACLSWPEIVYGPENEFVAVGICADWARGRTMPHELGRRR